MAQRVAMNSTDCSSVEDTNMVPSPTGNVDTQTPPTTKHARSDTTNSLKVCEAQSSSMGYLRDRF